MKVPWYLRQGCGTAAAYRRHRRNGETACPACKQAHALANAMWREQALKRQKAPR